MAQIMQPDRRQPRLRRQLTERPREPVRRQRITRTPVNTNPLSLYEPAASNRSNACRHRCRRNAATVVRSNAIVLTLRAVFGGPTTM